MSELIAYKFADFTVDLERRELRKTVHGVDDELCYLRPQCFSLLVYLLSHRNQTITNTQIWRHLQSDSRVDREFTSQKLSRAATDLRKVIRAAAHIWAPRHGSLRLDCELVDEVHSTSFQGDPASLTHDDDAIEIHGSPSGSITGPRLKIDSDIPKRLLSYVWSYPLIGENEGSWAIKESAALRGKIGSAREEPALGIAIITTELALMAFGEAATSRVDRCIAWALDRTQREYPHMILEEVRNQADYIVEQWVPDFRHTIAFGVILARAGRHYSYLESHLKLVLDNQLPDGSWPSESVKTISPLFTAFYAIELLHLAFADIRVSAAIRADIPSAKLKGMRWLMNQRTSDGLWKTGGGLGEFPWDPVLGTAWVVHRLIPTANAELDGWRSCLDAALFSMINCALSSRTWVGTPDNQRFRVEARVAGAVRRALRMKSISRRSDEAARLFVSSWTARAENWMRHLPSEELDLGTAAFMVWGLVDEDRLAELSRQVLSDEAMSHIQFSGPK